LADYPLTPPIRERAPDLSRRAQPYELPELMDQPCTRAELRACLRDIAWLNRVLLGYRPIFNWIESLNLPSPVRILDVGSGYGDTLRRIEQWARGKGIAVQLTGLDLNPHTAAIAAEATPARSRIQWIKGDVFAFDLPEAPHLILSSLMVHHLTDPELIRLLRWMETHAITGWFINDLSRNIVPYRLLYAFTRLMGLHRFVQHDGPASIARAFVPEDWRRYCDAAGLASSNYTIRGFTPGRLCVARTKTA
jgi:SAM-dependent methyltransferase